MEQQIRADIEALNLRCLLVIRDLARVDPAKAYQTFGVSIETAETVAKMSVADIHDIARTSALMFRVVVDSRSLSLIGSVPDGMRGGVLELCARH